MKTFITSAVAVGLMFCGIGQIEAGTVTVKKSHLCCPACVKAVQMALADVEGVSNASADQKTKTISFDATDDAAAKRGVEALAKAGFYGAAAHGDKVLEYPKPKVEKGAKSDTVTFTEVHICCGACVKGIQTCMKDVKNVTDIKPDSKTKTVTLTGEGIDLLEALEALNDGGFHGNVKGKE